MWWSKIMRTFK